MKISFFFDEEEKGNKHTFKLGKKETIRKVWFETQNGDLLDRQRKIWDFTWEKLFARIMNILHVFFLQHTVICHTAHLLMA